MCMAQAPFWRTALDHVDLKIQKDEILVIGHTGSGKSTLIQHFNGLLKPSEGEVLLDGQSIWNAKGKCARETRFASAWCSGTPNTSCLRPSPRTYRLRPPVWACRERGSTSAYSNPCARSVWDETMANRSPFALSGGQKRRVASAGVIAMRPDVLVLDEPTAGLDPAGRDEILGLIKRYHDQSGATVLIVSHSMEDIARLADRLLVRQAHAVLFCDTPREVFSHAEEIIAAGLDIPMITKVMIELKKRGHDVDTSVFTVAQALDALRACKHERGAR